jgi:hypothetical protein
LESRVADQLSSLARDVANVRAAGQSRCRIYQLRPLAPEVARQLLTERMHALGIKADEDVLDVLVAAGQGLPMRLAGLAVAALVTSRLRSVRQALGLDWVEAMAASLACHAEHRITNDGCAYAIGRCKRRRTVRRVRVFFRHLYLHGVRRIPIASPQ